MYSFPKAARLRKKREFQAVARGGNRRYGQWILVEVREGKGKRPRLGITVTRRWGKAHKRNRFKRIVREAFRLTQHHLPPHKEIIVKPRSQAEKATSRQILEELQSLIY